MARGPPSATSACTARPPEALKFIWCTTRASYATAAAMRATRSTSKEAPCAMACGKQVAGRSGCMKKVVDRPWIMVTSQYSAASPSVSFTRAEKGTEGSGSAYSASL